VDFIGPFPLTHPGRNQYVLVIRDHLTRFMEVLPVKSTASKYAITVLEEYVIYRHSCPKEIVVDQGTSFTSDEFHEFANKYKIDLKFTTPFHPQTNAITERSNSTLKSIVSKYVNDHHKYCDIL